MTVCSAVLCLIAQLCPTLCGPTDCSPPGSSVHGDSPRNNTGVGCHTLLQGIFPTQESNSDLLHCRWILYQLSHQESHQVRYMTVYICQIHRIIHQKDRILLHVFFK